MSVVAATGGHDGRRRGDRCSSNDGRRRDDGRRGGNSGTPRQFNKTDDAQLVAVLRGAKLRWRSRAEEATGVAVMTAGVGAKAV